MFGIALAALSCTGALGWLCTTGDALAGFAGPASAVRSVTVGPLAIAAAGFAGLSCATGVETELELEIAGCETGLGLEFTSTDGPGAAGMGLAARFAAGRP
jgi:hypothetical protein